MEIDPRTPVLVGVGQAAERVDTPEYRAMSAVELAAGAARSAVEDAAGRDVVPAIEVVAGVRQFEISTPGAPAPLGKSDNYPRSVADRLGAEPARALLEVAGGQSPQHLVTELAGTIAEGREEVALVFGSEAISTTRHLARAEDRPDFTEQVGGQLDDRGFGLDGLVNQQQSTHGLTNAIVQYALLDNARRGRIGQSRDAYARSMGELFEPFTKVAAHNPFAAAPAERSADELATVTERNRRVADPYPRLVVSRDQVNQGAAVLIMSVAAARRHGVPQEKWVFLHGHADLVERELLDRQDLGRAPAAALAVRHALDMARVAVGELRALDLYSCFPIAVFNICDALDLAPDDPRGLTLTGGLPFFGGAGNNYSMHAIAEMVTRVRAEPGAFGLVGANGGTLSKYSAGVYSTTPAAWKPNSSTAVQAEIDSWPGVDRSLEADGWGLIESYTISYLGKEAPTGIVVGRLESDGSRFLATTAKGDEETVRELEKTEPLGRRVFVRSFGFGNRVTFSEQRMTELFPPRPKVLRDDYEFVRVRREGHLLEITIDRPDVRNALTPEANEELDEIFDAYFTDPDLWVAVLTGAGNKAFSAGNDLAYTASGKTVWTPKNGFAGLTSRPGRNKPVIAAVNGYAMGGGFEIALACDLIVADTDARFALSEVRVGLVAGAGGLIRLPRVLPPALAKEMILTGRAVGAEEAARLGIVNRVAEAGSALPAARELADEILAVSPTSVRVSLEVMADTEGIPDTVDAARHRPKALEELMISEDMIEGVAAFTEKRAPQWRNR